MHAWTVEGMQTVTSHCKGNQAVDFSLSRAARSRRGHQSDDERIGQMETADQSGVGRDEVADFALGLGD